MVGQWVRLHNPDRPHTPTLGWLKHCTPIPGNPGLWRWVLHTPTGRMIGGPNFPAEPLRPEHRHDLARARRQLTQRLRKDRETLAGLLAHGDPAGVLGRAVARLERLEQSLPDGKVADRSTRTHKTGAGGSLGKHGEQDRKRTVCP